MNLEQFVKFHSPGYVIDIYNDGNIEEIIFGNRETRPEIKACNKDTLYDIASLTKTYTATLVYMAYEEKKLDLFDSVFAINKNFIHLKEVTVLDLLSHNQEIWTDGYLGDATTKDMFYKMLYSAYVKSTFPTYVDTHYIILSTVLEAIYKKPFEVLLQEKIFNPLHLSKTTINPVGDNIASNNYETLNGMEIDFITPGKIHDTKGRIAKELEITTGHASIFTTGSDLLTFLKSFLDARLLKKETIEFMLQHRDKNKENYEILKNIVTSKEINEMYEEAIIKNLDVKVMRTYNNMGTRFKNSINDLNDVPHNASLNTIVFSGFTGPSFLIDFDKKIIIVVMCNVMHNTKLSREERKKNTDCIIEEIYNKIS